MNEFELESLLFDALARVFIPKHGEVKRNQDLQLGNDLIREIDLIVQHENHFYLIEVKSLSRNFNRFTKAYEQILSYAQRFQQHQGIAASNVHALVGLPTEWRQNIMSVATQPNVQIPLSAIITRDELEDVHLLFDTVKKSPSLEGSGPSYPVTTPKHHSVFISYRRSDNAWAAGRLADHLQTRFDPDEVFFDTRSIDLGEDFAEVIMKRIEGSSILLAVIGHNWLTVSYANGRRRLDHEEDFVRLEIRMALEKKLILIPILIDDTHMPSEYDLPTDISEFARKTAARLTSANFDTDVKKLEERLITLGLRALSSRRAER